MIFSIEGNIGSGKSAFCNYLKDHFSKCYNKPHYTNVLFVDQRLPDKTLDECKKRIKKE